MAHLGKSMAVVFPPLLLVFIVIYNMQSFTSLPFRPSPPSNVQRYGTVGNSREISSIDDAPLIKNNNNTVVPFKSPVTTPPVRVLLDKDDYKPRHQKVDEFRRTLPQAIIIGVKKGGTSTLQKLLQWHPRVSPNPTKEVHYFDTPSKHSKGIEWYRSQMGPSRPNQTTIEKTPRYFVSSVAPEGIRDEVSPKTKIIILLRDPVERSVSDYLQLQLGTSKALIVTGAINSTSYKPPYLDPIYENKPSFERSVLDNDGNIKVWNGLINVGLYSNHIRRWLDVFPRKQVLVLDSDLFTQEPLATVREVENFLGLTPFFRKEHFYFDQKKGFFCFNMSGNVSCMNASKGKQHPFVDPLVIGRLKEFYKPYDKILVELLHQKFSWMEEN